jgi:serpin B
MKTIAMRAPVYVLASVLLVTAMRAPASPPGVKPTDRSALVSGNNAFALALYAQLEGRKGNLFFSPFSISSALAMTYSGARGETAAQMAEVLHLGLQAPHPAFAALLEEFRSGQSGRGDVLTMANALWGQKGFAFRPEFLDLVRDNYHAGLNSVDFLEHPEQARQTINAWVEKETRQKIRDMLSPSAIVPSTRLVLTNAIYFKGRWNHEFGKGGTQNEVFWRDGEQEISVPLMHQRHDYGYAETADLQILELPYRGRLSLVVVLPKERTGLGAVEKSMNAEPVQAWLTRLKPSAIDLALPRFKITASMNLKDELTQLGMPLAFSAKADFSAMTDNEGLHISAVIHKTFVDVNEEGTEAAAATAVTMETSARMEPRPPVVFRADHPFLFMIRDSHTGSILFLGRLTAPTK